MVVVVVAVPQMVTVQQFDGLESLTAFVAPTFAGVAVVIAAIVAAAETIVEAVAVAAASGHLLRLSSAWPTELPSPSTPLDL